MRESQGWNPIGKALFLKNEEELFFCLPVLHLVILKFADEKARSFFFFDECILLNRQYH